MRYTSPSGPIEKLRAVHRVVALQQEPVEVGRVRRGIRKEVHLVAQRALVQIEVDRGGVASVAPEAHVPTPQLRVVLDGLDPRLGRDDVLEVRGDQIVRGALARRELVGSFRHHRQVQRTSSRAPTSA